MHWLFTALNAVLFVSVLAMTFVIARTVARADRRRKSLDDAIAKLHVVRAELAAHSVHIDALGDQLHKLRGKFYATQRTPAEPPPPPTPETADEVRERLRKEHGVPTLPGRGKGAVRGE